ncbi:MAG TPA: hypothetical protein VF629_00940 [Hymenobacter sp.]|jgi:hypothetical protein|uniref:hypothetical protein n=1 Tax=Hymenobacter sp. TaxID=1898978 RepID=UPI002ED9D351
MANQLKLPYGLRDGQLWHISQVATGLACKCICLGCGALLVARNSVGNVKVAHFAHYQALECTTGLQTAIHLAAKDIIAQHKQLCLPGMAGHLSFTPAFWESFSFDARPYADELFDTLGFMGTEFISSSYETDNYYSFPARLVVLDEVILEKRTGDIIPDIMVRIGSKWLLVEVAVTHFVDEEKKTKIRAMGLPAIEIDLSKIRRDISMSDLEELIIRGEQHKKWLNNPELRRVVSQRRQRYFEECRAKIERLHAKQLREEARQAAREQWRANQATKSPAERALAQQRKQEFYSKNCRPIVERIAGGLEFVHHVDDCPKAAHQLLDKPYANVQWDCSNCLAFRGYRPYRTAIVCLYEYLRHKGDII